MLTVEQYNALTPDQQAELARLAEAAPLWAPLPGPQTGAYTSRADIIGYGGSAGGGKTDLAIGMAIQRHHRTLIMRRTAPELMGIHERMRVIVGSDAGYSGKDSVWRLAVDGKPRQIEYGSAPNAGDETKYQGRPHDLLVFDEAVAFPRHVPMFLRTWLRHENPDQHCQMLLTFNPPTSAEGAWVVEFFGPWLDPLHERPAKPGELRWYLTGPDGKDREVEGPQTVVEDGIEFRAMSRTFFPARVTDNPHYMASGYASQLYSLEEPFRSMMLHGSFAGTFEDDPFQLFPSAWIDAAMARWKEPDIMPTMDSVGFDVARGGRDSSVVFTRHGTLFLGPHVAPGTATDTGPKAGSWALMHARDRARIHIDVIGVGASPYDWLDDKDYPVVPVNVAEAATETSRNGIEFFNLRSQLHWQMREALDPARNNGIALPPDKALRREMAAFKWSMKGRKLYVDGREDVIKRLGKSPDRVSALVLANMDSPDPVALSAELATFRRPDDALTSGGGLDYNPLDNM